MELKIYPDRVLRRKCRPIERIDDEFVRRAHEMLDFMYQADGLGLAAPQVGRTDQIVTLDVEQQHEGERIFINPRIAEREGDMEHDEGCLSLPGLQVNVPRSERVVVVAYTLEGERLEIEAEGLAACAWQHEVDHLNGILIVDRLSPTAITGVRRQLKRLEQEQEAK